MNSMFLSLLNWRTLDEARFTLLENQGPFEIRYYQRMLCARIKINGLFEEAVTTGMGYLNDFVEGNNFKVSRITNHGPMFYAKTEDSWEVSLILPENQSINDLPSPINRLIRIEETIAGKAAALRFSGSLSGELIERRCADLNKWIKRKGLRSSGPVRVSGQDFLFPLPFYRNNEIMIDVV